MKVPLLDLGRQHTDLQPALEEAMHAVIAHARFILGPEVDALERQLETYLGVRHAIGVASGTDALWLSLRALGVGAGDLVLTSPFTFFASCSAILCAGATPVFADIDPDTFNLDPTKVREALAGESPVWRRLGLDPRCVKAVMPVHLYGQPVDLLAFDTVAEEFGVALAEDAAQALGAVYRGQRIGNANHPVAFSFFPTKNLGALGDGGLVSTNDDQLADRLRRLRAHGARAKYHHELVGTNSRLDTLQAAVLLVKLPHLDAWLAQRRAHARAYDEALAAFAPVQTPHHAPDRNHTFHQYTIRVPGGRRDALAAHLDARGIGHAIYYPTPVHLQVALAASGHLPGDFPRAEAACTEVLSLPLFPELTADERSAVIDAVRSFPPGVSASP